MNPPAGRVRVLMVNAHGSRGGAARMAATLARAIDSSGAATVCLYHCGDARKEPPLYGIRRLGGRQLNAFLARCGGSLAVFDLGVAREIARKAKAADVLHLHNLHGYYLDWDGLLRAVGERPLVWTWHDMWGATGRCGFAFQCEGWRSGCDPCPHLEYYPAAWIDRAAPEYRRKSEWLGRLSHLMVATPSHWLRQIAIDRGLSPDRVVCVPNPVDVSSYEPVPAARARERLGLPIQGRYLLFVAANRDNPLKGYRDFLEVVEQTGWVGLVAGGKPREVPARVKYVGEFRDAKALSLCYSAADALVVPSLFDNSPNAVIESMACGTPVFGYAVGGIPSQMHSLWGGVVPVGDSRALADLVLRQLENGGKPDAAVAELREFAQRQWAPARVADCYVDLYRRAMAAVDRTRSSGGS